MTHRVEWDRTVPAELEPERVAAHDVTSPELALPGHGSQFCDPQRPLIDGLKTDRPANEPGTLALVTIFSLH